MDNIILNDINNNNLPNTIYDLDSNCNYQFNQDIYTINKSDTKCETYYVSNSLCKNLNLSQKKNIMFYLKDKHDILIDGCDSTFLAEGKQAFIILDNCKNITFKNMNFDYSRPTVTEFEVVDIGSDYIDAKFNVATPFSISNGELKLVGPDGDYIGESKYGLTQEYDPITQTTVRMHSPIQWKVNIFEGITHIEDQGTDTARIYYKKIPKVKIGCIYEFRNLLRDGVGFFITESENVRFENVSVHFMHGLGLVAQCSKDIAIESCEFAPSNNRKTTGFADLIHCIGCEGTIIVNDSTFDGAHDDAINVHGVHQRITKYISDNEIEVSFTHPDAFGYKYYNVHDRIQLVDAYSLLPFLDATITKASMIDLFTTRLSLDINVPKFTWFKHRKCVVENVSKNSVNLIYTNNYLKNIPTRGVLVSTMGKVLIKDNHFYKTQMSAILIADDAKNWFESGRVTDVTIENNFFEQSQEPVIFVHPESTKYKGPVHKNITISNNKFDLDGDKVIDLKSTDNITIENNTDIEGNKIDGKYCKFNHCTNIKLC